MENDNRKKANKEETSQNEFEKEFEKQVNSVKKIFELYNNAKNKDGNSNEESER